jgi:hypothetical protein
VLDLRSEFAGVEAEVSPNEDDEQFRDDRVRFIDKNIPDEKKNLHYLQFLGAQFSD